MAEEKTSSQEKVRELTKKIEIGIADLFQSGRVDEYLRVMGKFHRYSLNNTILIFLQRPDATLCCGYNAWKKEFGRHVKKGEKGIKILAPSPYNKTVEVNKLDPHTQKPMVDDSGNAVKESHTVQVPWFRTATIFDVAQTEGPPLPQLCAELTGDVPQFDMFMEALRRTSPVPIETATLEDGVDGYYSRDKGIITIQEGMAQLQTVCSTLHEIVHSEVHGTEQDASQPKALKEITAEAVSMAVCACYGLDTSESSIPYLASWSSGKDVPELKACLQIITDTTKKLIDRIDRNFAEICKERGVPAPKRLITEAEEPPPAKSKTAYHMPDPSVPEDALSEAGYHETDLLPLSAERACELIDRDMSVYVVQQGENPMMAFDREEIMDYPAGTVFAVPRTEWEASAEYQQAMAAMENPGASQEMIPKRRTYNRTGKGRTTKKTKPERGR